MQILVLLIAPIGDTLFATPALKALRNGFPCANIAVLATVDNQEILVGNQNVDRLLIIHTKTELLKQIITLSKTAFDLVIALSHTGSYLSYLFNARKKTGFKGSELNWIYNYNPPDNRNIHAVDYNLALACDIGGIADKNPQMEIPLTAEDYGVLAELNLGEDNSLIAIHPGGRFFAYKRWPVEKYRALIKEIDKNINTNIVLLGGDKEKDLNNKVIDIDYSYNHLPFNLAGELSIKKTAALLTKAALFIGNDSAPQHIAAAVKTPVITIFGPTNPDNFYPYGTEYKIVRKEKNCSPCFHWLGGIKQYFPECRPDWLNGFTVPCMEDIKVENVMDKIESFNIHTLQFKTLIS